MKRFSLLVAIMMFLTAPMGAVWGQQSDNYRAYMIDDPITLGVSVDVSDQFLPDTTTIQVMDLEHFLNPVQQDGSGYVDSTAHMTWWSVEPNVVVDRDIRVTNKFGVAVPWHVDKLEFILAPARKNEPGEPPDNMNHFLCYSAFSDVPINEEVFLEDQFGADTVRVFSTFYFCSACTKDHAGRFYPIVDDAVSLAVYEIIPAFEDAPSVFLRDQFDIWTAPNVRSAPFLFVPSTKDVPTPTRQSSWGRIKSLYRRP